MKRKKKAITALSDLDQWSKLSFEAATVEIDSSDCLIGSKFEDYNVRVVEEL